MRLRVFFPRLEEKVHFLCFSFSGIVAGISEQIKDKPVALEILGEKLVLVRGSNGKIQCLQDVCPHRGAPLHLG